MRRRYGVILLFLASIPTAIQAQTVDEPTCKAPGCQLQTADWTEDVGGRALWLRERVSQFESLDGTQFDGEPTVTKEGFQATIRFSDEPAQEIFELLTQLGVDFSVLEGSRVEVGNIYQGFIPWRSLPPVARAEMVERVEATWIPVRLNPVDKTSRLVGATELRERPEFGLDGQGVTVADFDTGYGVLHPHLFRADGGHYVWRDANGNRIFDLGIDGVDLNDDGEISDNERLKLLDARYLETRVSEPPESDGSLDPREDWLYIDRNQNGERDAGVDSGFDEATPAYGEPIFVVDDVDRNNYLDMNEKLVRLGSSKFKKIGDASRGENLINQGVNRGEDHAVAVNSIIAGGQHRYHDRVGLAPKVELLGYRSQGGVRGSFDGGTNFDLGNLEDAIDSGADVFLFEFGLPFFTPLDGSSNYERAISEAAEENGIVPVLPVGNLNGAKAHIEKQMNPDSPATFPFIVDEGFSRGTTIQTYNTAYITLYLDASLSPKLELRKPGGDYREIDISESSGSTDLGSKQRVTFSTTTTSRDRRIVNLSIQLRFGSRSESLTQGTWTVRMSQVDESADVFGRLFDRYSGWGVGIRWANPTENRGTLTFPATADVGLGIAAYGARQNRGEQKVGELRAYSGRGPRFDGKRVVDIAAPADPFAAMVPSRRYVERYGNVPVPFTPFGGTSGAGPHAAAAVALLQEAKPEWGPDKLMERLTGSADNSGLKPFGSVPNRHWGAGKLNVYDAVTNAAKSEDDTEPNAELQIRRDGGNLKLDASATEDVDGGKLEYRFDPTYDGQYETGWQSDPEYGYEPEALEPGVQILSKVMVRDAAGNRSGALAEYRIQEKEAESEMDVTEGEENTSDPDATSRSDASTDVDTHADLGATAEKGPADDSEEKKPESSGCACSSQSGPSQPGFVWVLSLLIVGIRQWRR
jgi:MYXO-CTERM domain-containing protein